MSLRDLSKHTNDGQLLTYGRLLGRMNTNTHFVVVWDCDAAGKAETLREDLPSGAKVTPYAFPKRPENMIAERGIENNYDEVHSRALLYQDDCAVMARCWVAGFKVIARPNLQTTFCEKGTPQYFTNFHDLHDIVNEILELAR